MSDSLCYLCALSYFFMRTKDAHREKNKIQKNNCAYFHRLLQLARTRKTTLFMTPSTDRATMDRVMFWGQECDSFYARCMHMSSLGKFLKEGTDTECLISQWPSLASELRKRARLTADADLHDDGIGWLSSYSDEWPPSYYGVLFSSNNSHFCLCDDGIVVKQQE